VGFPDDEYMTCEDGLPENHFYVDLRGLPPEAIAEVREAEAALLALGEDADERQVSDLAEYAGWLPGIDPGVATTVAALSIIGACPVTSCRGGEGLLRLTVTVVLRSFPW
jgi:hypothetical protein